MTMTPTKKKKFNLGKIEISMEANGYAKRPKPDNRTNLFET